MLRILISACALICMIPLHAEVIYREGNGFFEKKQSQYILHVKGTPYEMGFQHGKLLKDLIKKNVSAFIDIPHPALQSRIESFQQHIPKLMRYIPLRFCEEMRGVADGANIPLEKIVALNIFPEMFHCSGITVSDEASKDGELYHVRVLDYAVGKSLQNTAVVMVVEPDNGHSFVNVSYAGFIGSVTGMNDQKIAMGEIGGWGYGHWNGMPMSFLFREILEKASNIEEAKTLLIESPRTCEYYYIISDGKNKESIGIYATESQIHFINPGEPYALLAPKNLPANYGTHGEHDKFCLVSCALHTSSHQTLLYDSKEQLALLYHEQPQHCLLLTGFCHPERYPVLAERMLSYRGKIDEKALQEIIKSPVARPSNLHNVIFLPSQLKLWIAHAGFHNEPACDQPYIFFAFEDLFVSSRPLE